MKLLLAHGADIDKAENEFGYSPLALALIFRNEHAATELLRAGASCSVPSRNGRTPMFIAAEKGVLPVIVAMLQRSPSPDAAVDIAR